MTEERMTLELVKLQEWIKEFVDDKAKGVVIGLSGGIDSTVVAKLCVNALGSHRVLGLIMPCYSSIEDERDGWLAAEAVGVDNVLRVDLDDAYDTLIKSFKREGRQLTQVSMGNIKARLRMTTLYTYANIRNYLVAGTGNKTELMVGYLTKFGDGGVDFEPIGDFYKTEVWEIGKHMGIPQEIIEKPPSAGLWAGQEDELELGMIYQELDKALEIISTSNTAPLSQRDERNVEKALALMASAQHKNTTPPYFDRSEI